MKQIKRESGFILSKMTHIDVISMRLKVASYGHGNREGSLFHLKGFLVSLW